MPSAIPVGLAAIIGFDQPLPRPAALDEFRILETDPKAAREAASNLRTFLSIWFAQRYGMSRPDGDLTYAIGESLNNAVIHGNLQRGVTVLVSTDPGTVFIINHLSHRAHRRLRQGKLVARLDLAIEAIERPDGVRESCHSGLGFVTRYSDGRCRYGILPGDQFLMYFPVFRPNC